MNTLCTPTIVSAAAVVSLLMVDMASKSYMNFAIHLVLGVIIILLVSLLCMFGAEFVAWGLLMTPLLLMVIGAVILKVRETTLRSVPTGAVISKTPDSYCHLDGKVMYKPGMSVPSAKQA